MQSRFTGSLLGMLSVSIVAVFYLTTIRDGHEWGDDFSHYILHAENLASGAPYATTNYLYNPDNPTIGPLQYPPGFPVVLAPIVRTFGLDLRPMKIEVVLFFIAALLVLHRLLQSLMPPLASAAVVLLVGLNPYFWNFKDQVLSDLPFLFFFSASLLVLTRGDEIENCERSRLALSCVAGVVMYAAYATRTVGIVLLPSLVLRDLIRYRWLTNESVVAGATFIALVGLQRVVLAGDTGYADLLTISATTIAANAVSYLRWLAEIWENGYVDVARRLLLVVSLGLAALGYVSLWKEPKATLLLVTPLIYLTVIVIWPVVQDTRFLIPVIPIYVACCIAGALALDRVIAARARMTHVVLGVFLAIVGATYIARYSTMPFGQLREGIGKAESRELFDFVKASIPRDQVIVFSRPRALALFGERIVTPPSRTADECHLWVYIKRVGATYVVTGPGAANDEAKYLAGFVRDFSSNLREVLRNADVAVYHVESVPASCLGGGV